MGAAVEAPEDMTSEMDGEAANAPGSRWIMDWARTAELLAVAGSRAVAEQPQDLLHGDDRSKRMVVNADHGPRLLVGRLWLGVDAASPVGAV